MPIYRFKCASCDKEVEKLVKVGTAECACDCGETATKQIDAPHVDKYSLQKFMFSARGNSQCQ